MVNLRTGRTVDTTRPREPQRRRAPLKETTPEAQQGIATLPTPVTRKRTSRRYKAATTRSEPPSEDESGTYESVPAMSDTEQIDDQIAGQLAEETAPPALTTSTNVNASAELQLTLARRRVLVLELQLK